MPVTAKLSKAFYDRLGEQIANELVEWFNQVDLTYRNDLRDLNELNFQRFTARLHERVGTLEAKVDVRFAALESELERRITALRSDLERQIAELRSDLERRMGALESRLEQSLAQLEAVLERRLGEQTRWLFVAWASLLIPIIGLWFKG